MTKFVLALYMCSMLSGQCPTSHYPGFSFNTHKECVEFGYRVAHGTFKSLSEQEEFTEEYIENSKIVIKFECRQIKVEQQIIPPPKPKGKAT